MSKNIGKVLEDNWKKSTPDDVLIYRPPDAAGSFGGGSNALRFSRRSPCDYMMFYAGYNTFWTLELKSFQGSCSFERTKEDKGIVHYYQVESLKKFAAYKNVCAGFILDFRSTDHTYFLNINQWDQLVDSVSKKSFNESDLLKYVKPTLINKKKLKVSYRYDVAQFLKDTANVQL
mgnify:CR=1 FL=1